MFMFMFMELHAPQTTNNQQLQYDYNKVIRDQISDCYRKRRSLAHSHSNSIYDIMIYAYRISYIIYHTYGYGYPYPVQICHRENCPSRSPWVPGLCCHDVMCDIIIHSTNSLIHHRGNRTRVHTVPRYSTV